MNNKVKRSLSICWALCLTLLICGVEQVQAQNNSVRSPYTRFGYGELINTTSVTTKAMGGVTIGVRNKFIVNSANPASYSAVDSMTFILDMGLSGGVSFLSEKQQHDWRILGNLDYLTVLFPVTQYMGLSAGIKPYAKRGYLFSDIRTNAGDVANPSKYLSRFSGGGDYNLLYLGIGGNVYKGLSLGVNANMVFGTESRSSQILFFYPNAYNPTFSHSLKLRGFRLDLGLQYEYKYGFEKDRSFVIGAVFTPKTKLFAHTEQLNYFVNNNATGGTATGTTNSIQTSDNRSDYQLPWDAGIGASYSFRDHWMLSADVKYTAWSKVKLNDVSIPRDQIRWALGGEWIPDTRSRYLFSRSAYRVGINGSNSYFTIPNNTKNINQGFYNLGATLGIGFPLLDRRSSINFSFDYKELIPSNSSMIHNHYIGLSVGILFNGNWFRKIQVD